MGIRDYLTLEEVTAKTNNDKQDLYHLISIGELIPSISVHNTRFLVVYQVNGNNGQTQYLGTVSVSGVLELHNRSCIENLLNMEDPNLIFKPGTQFKASTSGAMYIPQDHPEPSWFSDSDYSIGANWCKAVDPDVLLNRFIRKDANTGLVPYPEELVQDQYRISRSNLVFTEKSIKRLIESKTVNNNSIISAESECERWLQGLMLNGGEKEKNKAEYKKEATKKFGVGINAFNRAWRRAIDNIGNQKWSVPGPRKTKQ